MRPYQQRDYLQRYLSAERFVAKIEEPALQAHPVEWQVPEQLAVEGVSEQVNEEVDSLR